MSDSDLSISGFWNLSGWLNSGGKSQKYYLVAFDGKKALEVLRHKMMMDFAFADDIAF